jgi:hypothetical protein
VGVPHRHGQRDVPEKLLQLLEHYPAHDSPGRERVAQGVEVDVVELGPSRVGISIVGGSAWEPTPWRAGADGGVGGAKQTDPITEDVRSVQEGLRLRGSSEPSKQIFKNLIHVWRGFIQKGISGAGGFEFRDSGSERALTNRALPSKQRAHCPSLKVQCEYLRGESSDDLNEIDNHFSVTGIQGVYSRLLQALMPEDGPARIVRIPGLIRGIAACNTRRPQSLLTRTHGGVNARSGPVQRPAGADAHRSQAVGCSLAKIGHAFGHVATNVLAPVIAGYTADNRANNESKHQHTPFRDKATAVTSVSRSVLPLSRKNLRS